MAITLGIAGKNDATGWSVITPTSPSADTGTPAGSRLIYVSSSTGDDSNAGSLAAPLLTIAAAMALVRNGKPDWVLLKKGDTFTDQSIGAHGYSGQDASNPQVFTSYPATAGARPKMDFPSTQPNGAYTAGVGATGGNFRVFLGLDFNCYTNDPNDGRYTGAGASFFQDPKVDYLHIEDCRFVGIQVTIGSWANQHVNFPGAETRSGTLIWHRNVVLHYNGVGTLWDNFADGRFTDSTWFSLSEGMNSSNHHNFYSQETSLPYTMTNCISVETSYNNIKVRGGANMSNCFLARGGVMLNLYGSNEGDPYGYNSGTNTIADCVFSEGRWTGTTSPLTNQGGAAINWEPTTSSTGQATDVLRNIFANNPLGPTQSSSALLLSPASRGTNITNNRCYKWAGGKFAEQSGGFVGTTFSGNVVDADADGLEDTSGLSTGWLHPEYVLADYGTSIGIGSATFNSVMEAICLQSKDNWSSTLTAPAINDFFRTQFGMTLLGTDGGSEPASDSRPGHGHGRNKPPKGQIHIATSWHFTG